MSFEFYQIFVFNNSWRLFVFALISGESKKVKNYAKIKFGNPEIPRNASSLKTI